MAYIYKYFLFSCSGRFADVDNFVAICVRYAFDYAYGFIVLCRLSVSAFAFRCFLYEIGGKKRFRYTV